MKPLAIFVALLFSWPVHAESSSPFILRIIDGDTVQLPAHRENTRIVGLDAPEVFHPDCLRERALGHTASYELAQLLSLPHIVTYQPTKCTGYNFGRSCAIVYSDDVDVAQTLIGMNLAIPYTCSSSRCPTRPHPSIWCR